jgi:hypothetical protein
VLPLAFLLSFFLSFFQGVAVDEKRSAYLKELDKYLVLKNKNVSQSVCLANVVIIHVSLLKGTIPFSSFLSNTYIIILIIHRIIHLYR